jgi:hypothetical protein
MRNYVSGVWSLHFSFPILGAKEITNLTSSGVIYGSWIKEQTKSESEKAELERIDVSWK